MEVNPWQYSIPAHTPQSSFQDCKWTQQDPNGKHQVTTEEGKAQSEKRSLTGRQIARMIYDVFDISGDNEGILVFTDLSKVQFQNDIVLRLRHKVGRSSISSHLQTTDSILESPYKMQVEKSEDFKYLLQVYAKEDNCR